MATQLRIQDGNPIWIADTIRPSKDTVVPTGSSPTLSAIKTTDTGVFVYVKVDNTGSEDIGVCSCMMTGLWTSPTPFQGYYNNSIPLPSPQTQFGVTFTPDRPTSPPSPSPGDTLTGSGINITFNNGVIPDRRAWAWSPDGRFFAYAYAMPGGGGNDWNLRIIALQNIIRPDGTQLVKGSEVATAQDVYVGAWTNSPTTPFSWVGSKAVIASGTTSAGSPAQISVKLTCPELPGSASQKTWSDTLVTVPTRYDYRYRVSPCASFVAIVPFILNANEPAHDVILVSTLTATKTSFRKNNAPIAVSINGLNPTITTNQHSANGVSVNLGAGAIMVVDDPECTFVGGGVQVHVDRVKVSTLPNANTGIVMVGNGNVGVLLQGKSTWVKVPNVNGWMNQSEPHWCLLAQTYTTDGVTIPRPWNGQAASPPPFPIGDDRCAQRNVAIT